MIRALRILAALWVVPILLLAWLRNQGQLMIQRLTVDPAALAGVPPYTGLFSNLGVALWLSTASVLLFLARTRPELRRLLWLPGLLSLLLGVDDGLMVHEELAPVWLGLDNRVVQPGLYVLYAALLGFALRAIRPWLSESGVVILLASLFCLGSSISVDMLKESHLLSQRNLLVLDEGFAMWLEDGLKLLGIVAWWGYWNRFGASRLKDVIAGQLK